MKYEYSFCFDFFFTQESKIAKNTTEDVQIVTDSLMREPIELKSTGKEIFTCMLV